MHEMHEITIRCEGGDLLTVAVLGRSHPGCTDYWDGNWLQVMVTVRVGGFRGKVSGDLRVGEVISFSEQLARLYELLQGEAAFETMEEWLSIRVTGDGCGHMTFRGVICDQPGIGNTLEFALETDQTFVRTTVAELAAVVRAFPIVGMSGD